MVLTVYRSLLNLLAQQGVVCNGSADDFCVYNVEAMGGVVCNGMAIVDEIEPVPPEQPETILCFKFRPGQTAYTKYLQPVLIVSAVAVESKGNVYLVNMYGKRGYFCESDLYTLTEAIAYQQSQGILYIKNQEKLEDTPVMPPPSAGAVKTEATPEPKISKEEILERALYEIGNLRLIVARPDPALGKSQIKVPVRTIVSGTEMLQRAMGKLNTLNATTVKPDPSTGKMQIQISGLSGESKEKILAKVLGEISRLNLMPVSPDPSSGKAQYEVVQSPTTEESLRLQAEKQIEKLNAMAGTVPDAGKTQVEIPQPPIIPGNAIKERALREIDRLQAIRETIEV